MCGCRRSPTPASRAISKAATCICARRNTWRRMRAGLLRRACAWSVAKQPYAKPALPPEEKSFLGRKLVNGHFVRAIELVPPRGHVPQDALDAAKELAAHGVDVVTIPDGPRSGARMSALALAVLVQQHSGLEALLQYSCRDRNLLGIQSEILGAHAMGVRNLLGITGDVRMLGDIPDARSEERRVGKECRSSRA